MYVNAVLHECFPARGQRVAYGANLWAHRFLLKLERKVSTFVAPSRFLADRLISWGIPANRVVQVRNVTHIPSQPPPFQTNGHGLFLGRLSVEKGVDVLLRALRSAGDPPFVIAGDGPARTDLEDLARELRLSGVRFVGSVDLDGVRDLLSHSSFLAAPSVSEENAPLSVGEALAHGRPVIVSRIGGLPELAAEGRGLICVPGDVPALADRIRRLTDTPQLCSDMGAKGRRFAEDELNESTHLRRLEEVYSTLVQATS
jgi:glycosyltransferase involved in cell wall biosynthesis